MVFSLIYIDNVVWIAPDCERINKLLQSLKDELKMTIEGDIQASLGIQFSCMPNSQIHLQQLGWIDCVPKTTDLQECNPNKTLTSQKHLSTDQE